MLHRIFARAAELETVLAAKKHLYASREDRHSFQQYIGILAEKQYKNSAAPYLHRDGNKISYCGTLLDLIDKLEEASDTNSIDEESVLLEMMAVTCFRPKLLFGVDIGEKHWDTTKDFEYLIRFLYQEWDILVKELSFCQRYIERGTKELDRPFVKLHSVAILKKNLPLNSLLNSPW